MSRQLFTSTREKSHHNCKLIFIDVFRSPKIKKKIFKSNRNVMGSVEIAQR